MKRPFVLYFNTSAKSKLRESYAGQKNYQEKTSQEIFLSEKNEQGQNFQNEEERACSVKYLAKTIDQSPS